ncbi:hypothetical protein QJS10_CPB14g01347 [Acorus calamus]|uniref:SHSP domain-containing protein n=1 Tax=Acorus calamus TaxID=4465 RepID=A0AAV9DDA8_ACOCL|nr:hypothetical protein QJS10_CPB14g01347 [Acorus calamus]
MFTRIFSRPWTGPAMPIRMSFSLILQEEVRVQVDSTGKLTVSGERRAGDTKYKRFKIVADIPKDSNSEKIAGQFEHGLLFLTMPKKSIEEVKQEEPQEITRIDDTTKGDKEEIKKGHGSEQECNTEHGRVLETMKVKGNEVMKGLGLKEKEHEFKTEHELVHETVQKGNEVMKDLGLEGKQMKKDLEGVVDVVLDKINRNRRVIVVAVAAFTIGFYVSRRLRSTGG